MPVAKSLWHIDSTSSTIRQEKLSPINDDLILRSLYSMISIGTERIVASGNVPESMYAKMQVPYMQGAFSFPVKYGYSLVGEWNGRVYHIMHPHQDHITCSPDSLTEIPTEIPAKRAVLISNLETICNAWWDAQPEQFEKILIAGFGLIGSLLAIWLKLKGFHNIFILEKIEERILLAKKLGFQTILPSEKMDFDLAYHTSSTSAGLQYCIDHMKFEGRIIDLSWYGDKPVSLTLGGNFHINRLKLMSSQVSTIPGFLQKDQTFSTRKNEVLQMLNNKIWDILLDQETSLENAVNWFKKIRSGQLANLSLVIKY
ncbi:MAG: zinc-binding alcohol dehydrogenase [Saprospiraceae bacterium]